MASNEFYTFWFEKNLHYVAAKLDINSETKDRRYYEMSFFKANFPNALKWVFKTAIKEGF